MASEMRLKLTRMTCVATAVKLTGKIRKQDLKTMAGILRDILPDDVTVEPCDVDFLTSVRATLPAAKVADWVPTLGYTRLMVHEGKRDGILEQRKTE